MMEYLNGDVIIQFDGIQGIDQGCPVPDSHLLWNRREGYHYSLYGVRTEFNMGGQATSVLSWRGTRVNVTRQLNNYDSVTCLPR